MQATMIAGSIRSRKPRVVRPSAESCLCVSIGDSVDWETNGAEGQIYWLAHRTQGIFSSIRRLGIGERP